MVSSTVQGLPRRHPARPDPATTRSVRTGAEASLMDQRAYPMAARCAECGMPVTSVSFFAAFYHDDPPEDGGAWTL